MTKIIPHHNCLNGEHVFIPNHTCTNTRSSWIESFVCTHCLVVVKKSEWEVHQQELARMAEAMDIGYTTVSSGPVVVEHPPYIPSDYKEPMNAAPKKPAPKPAPKKA